MLELCMESLPFVFSLSSLCNIVNRDKFRGSAGKFQGMPIYFDIYYRSVFPSMPPNSGSDSKITARGVSRCVQWRDLFRWTDIGDCHRQKFFAGISVMTDGCIVYCQKDKRLEIKHPHRQRISFKQQPVTPFRFQKLALDFLTRCDITRNALQLDNFSVLDH